MLTIVTARAYDEDQPEGYRVLVDRLWPRGVAKDSLPLDEWAKDVTPTSELRKAYHQGELDFPAFRDRFHAELADTDAIAELYERIDKRRHLVLLTAVKDIDHSHVPVIIEALRDCDAG